MESVDYNIEYAHIYSSDLNGNLSNVSRNIEKTKVLLETLNNKSSSYSLSVLVDDYSEDQSPIPSSEIFELFFSLGLSPDNVVMESEMIKEADSLIKNLPEKFLIQEENRYIFKSESKDIHFAELFQERKRYKSEVMDRINMGTEAWNEMQKKKLLNLKQQRVHSDSNLIIYFNDGKTIRYSCPLLAACWYLTRLGVEPFYSSIKQSLNSTKPFIGKNLITILPLNFLKVESTAIELIGLCKSKSIYKCKRRIEYYFTA